MKNLTFSSSLLAFYFSLLLVNCVSAQTAKIATEEEAQSLLATHNEWRAEVGVAPLTWSIALSESAKIWATTLEKKCEFRHSQNNYGENLWRGTSGYFSPADAVNSWGSEKEDYNYSKNKCKTGKVCGHYTQIVWENTKSVGCATMNCDGMTTWVCQYDPPGNWVGEKPYE